MNGNIIFDSSSGSGGYSDRLVGLVSTAVLSDYLNRTFYINWNKPKLDEILKISNNYVFNGTYQKGIFLNLLDDNGVNFAKQVNVLLSSRAEDIIIKTNQNLFRYICQPQVYDNTCLKFYKKIYTEYFHLKENTLNKINKIKNSMADKYIIGIQIRAGDGTMKSNDLSVLPDKIKPSLIEFDTLMVDKFFNEIQHKIDELSLINYKIYVATDCVGMRKQAKKIFGDNVLFHDDEISHFDHNGNITSNQIETVIIDHILLSECNLLFICPWGGMGRTASLIYNPKTFGFYRPDSTFREMTILQRSDKTEIFP